MDSLRIKDGSDTAIATLVENNINYQLFSPVTLYYDFGGTVLDTDELGSETDIVTAYEYELLNFGCLFSDDGAVAKFRVKYYDCNDNYVYGSLLEATTLTNDNGVYYGTILSVPVYGFTKVALKLVSLTKGGVKVVSVSPSNKCGDGTIMYIYEAYGPSFYSYDGNVATKLSDPYTPNVGDGLFTSVSHCGAMYIIWQVRAPDDSIVSLISKFVDGAFLYPTTSPINLELGFAQFVGITTPDAGYILVSSDGTSPQYKFLFDSESWVTFTTTIHYCCSGETPSVDGCAQRMEDFCGVFADPFMYIFGGFTNIDANDGILNSTTKVTLDGISSCGPKLPTGLEGASSAVLDNTPFVFGGYYYNPSGDPDYELTSTHTYQLDTITESWSQKSDMIQGLTYHSSSVLNNRIYTVCGLDENDDYSGAIFSYVVDTWTTETATLFGDVNVLVETLS